jgi:hypothetical protein
VKLQSFKFLDEFPKYRDIWDGEFVQLDEIFWLAPSERILENALSAQAWNSVGKFNTCYRVLHVWWGNLTRAIACYVWRSHNTVSVCARIYSSRTAQWPRRAKRKLLRRGLSPKKSKKMQGSQACACVAFDSRPPKSPFSSLFRLHREGALEHEQSWCQTQIGGLLQSNKHGN